MSLREEFEILKSGQTVQPPLCTTPYLAVAGQTGDDVVDIAELRLMLLQAECDRIASD